MLGHVNIVGHGNTLSAFARSMKLLMEILRAESENVIKRFCDNKMVVNPNYLYIYYSKKQSNNKTKAIFNRKRRNCFIG